MVEQLAFDKRQTWYCEAGDMQLSVQMARELEAAIREMPVVAIPDEDEHEPRKFPWYCPRCGQEVWATGDKLEELCHECGFRLTSRQVYQLVEIHPHKTETGWL
jgi:DNA-directed RNA polymerase subunit RPC12/RpoP